MLKQDMESMGKNARFTDPNFGPTLDSLCKQSQWQKEFQEYTWARSFKNPTLLDDNGDVNFVLQ